MGVLNPAKLPDSSFRDVPALFQSSTVSNKGRKTVTHEFPDSGIRSVEDLGPDNNIFTIGFDIDYSVDFSRRNNFITALEQQGSGLLTIPMEETQEVTVVSYTRNDSKSSLGITTFNITFEKSEINRFPEVVEGSTGLISNLKNEVSDKNNTLLSEKFSSVKNAKAIFSSSVSKVTQVIEDKTKGIRKLASNTRSSGDGFAAFTSSLNVIVAEVNSLVQAPSDLANKFQTTFNNLEVAFDNALGIFDGVKGMFGFVTGDENVSGNSTTQASKANNQDLINNLISTSALTIAYNAAVNIGFDNVDDLNIVDSTLEDGFQALDDDLDDDIYQRIVTIKEEVADIFNNLRISLPQITTLEFINAQPLGVLVYQLYGSLDNQDEIEALNNFTDVSSVSGIIKVLSDV